MILDRLSRGYREIRDICVFDVDPKLPGYSPNFEDNIFGCKEYSKLPEQKKAIFKAYIKNITQILDICIKGHDIPKSTYSLAGIDFTTGDGETGLSTVGKEVCICFRDENKRSDLYSIFVSLESPGEIISCQKE